MKDKARANLKASKLLVEKELLDPAMSRLYYALFQAGVHAMTLRGTTPESLSMRALDGRWNHTLLAGNAALCRGRREDLSLFRRASALRAQADYYEASVQRQQLTPLIPEVEQFLAEVCA